MRESRSENRRNRRPPPAGFGRDDQTPREITAPGAPSRNKIPRAIAGLSVKRSAGSLRNATPAAWRSKNRQIARRHARALGEPSARNRESSPLPAVPG